MQPQQNKQKHDFCKPIQMFMLILPKKWGWKTPENQKSSRVIVFF